MFRACQLLSHFTVKHSPFAVKHAPRRAYTMTTAPTLMSLRDLPPHLRPPLIKVPPNVNSHSSEMSPKRNGRLRNGGRLPSSSRTRNGTRLSARARPLSERPIIRKGPIRKPYKKKKKQVFSRPNLSMIQFGKNAGWLLRHGAKHLGFPIRPDGFMRVQDALHHSTLNRHTQETFLEHAINDPPQRFEVKKERDYFAVSDVEVWWVRAKEGHDIPGVYADRKRLIPDTTLRLTEVYFRTGFDQWEKIRKRGIPQAHAGLIRLSATSSVKSSPPHSYNRVNAVPIRFVTIAVDIRQAFALGIEFYRTRRGYIISAGNDEGVIPPSVFSSAVETVVSREVLKPYVK